MKARILSLVCFIVVFGRTAIAEIPLGPIHFLGEGDTRPDNSMGLTILRSVPVVAKAIIPVGLAIGSISNSGSLGVAGIMALAWTLPSSFLLVNAWQGNAEGTRLWRYISFGVDAASFAALIGLGIYTISQPSSGGENWGGLVGALSIAFSIPFGVSAGIDLIPFPTEGRGSG